MMKLALGTVQFGLNYGISNQQGQVSPNQVKDILLQAQALGIDTLDCAGAYGNSEKVLGELGASERFNLISKIPTLTADKNSITPYLEQSLTDLQCTSVQTLLFHQADNLLNHPSKTQLFSELLKLKVQKKVNSIGVSVYNPEQLTAIAKQYPIDIVQAPINVFDQRFISKNIIELCRTNKIKLHARSLFLQGLLFIEKSQIKPYFKPYQEKLAAFSALAQSLSCSKLTLALALLAQDSLDEKEVNLYGNVIEKLVIGVCSKQQLLEVVSAYQQAKSLAVTSEELSILADTRLGFINPSLWQI
ncbi:aldo/keto reductase [Colwellia ponticola]|uniref:Aldo/keto reductase n=1 Tax=Colwellia ponticola TaxID=2304625 RepID=A0A8H2JNY0_9GAMM|nr:aldo/keto reductase [Colwellia ponticola]TMM44954.1 aldo/keto reductase [Colwellia ponticola]